MRYDDSDPGEAYMTAEDAYYDPLEDTDNDEDGHPAMLMEGEIDFSPEDDEEDE